VSHKGDLTEAQKLLLQKFPQLPDDDPLIELAAWNASLEQKVDDFGSRLDVWTNAILKQTDLSTQQNQLIVSQNLTLQETAKNNAALGQTLLQFKQGLSQLQQEFTTLKTIIATHGTSLKSLSDQNQGLNRKLDDLSLKLKTLGSNVDSLITDLKTLTISVSSLKENWNSKQTVVLWIISLLFAMNLIQGFLLLQVRDKLDSSNAALNSVLIRLKRLEER
jgi:DNA repair exonuclease SbcCD ATPase subunit